MATLLKPGINAAHFPVGGIDLSQAFYRQPPREVLEGTYGRTTPHAVNVLGFETEGERLRGGSRPGLLKLAGRPVNYLVQLIDQIITDDDNMQYSNSGRLVSRIAILDGDLYSIRPGETEWLIATNDASATPPLNETGIMQSAANVQNLYFADGTNWTYFNPRDNTMNDWEADEGTLPVDEENNKPRLICTWRGRTVLSGLLLDGQSVFASAIDDPHDWDYAPVAFTAAQAWALTTGEQGVVGDKVTGLIPYSDDVLFIGGEHSLQVLTGDITAGGRRQFITDAIGMAWGKAWCRDPQGNIFFVSNKLGIYVMQPNQAPQRISQPVEQLIRNIDTGDTNIVCGYDSRSQAIHFFFSPLAEPGPARHLTLELRTNSWSELVFKNHDHDPLCCAIFEGNEPGDRGLFFGSWDGYVNTFDPEAADDLGVEIESEVVIGPFLTPVFDAVTIQEVQGELAGASGDVSFEILLGKTPEEALASDPVYTGTFSAGLGYTHPVRRNAKAMYIRLKSVNKWAMERARVKIDTRGPVRQRAG